MIQNVDGLTADKISDVTGTFHKCIKKKINIKPDCVEQKVFYLLRVINIANVGFSR